MWKTCTKYGWIYGYFYSVQYIPVHTVCRTNELAMSAMVCKYSLHVTTMRPLTFWPQGRCMPSSYHRLHVYLYGLDFDVSSLSCFLFRHTDKVSDGTARCYPRIGYLPPASVMIVITMTITIKLCNYCVLIYRWFKHQNYRIKNRIKAGATTAYRAGVVVDLEVRLVLGILVRFWLAKRRRLAHMVLVQRGKEGLVGRLREHALLLKDGEDTHRLDATHCNTLETESVHKDHTIAHKRRIQYGVLPATGPHELDILIVSTSYHSL